MNALRTHGLQFLRTAVNDPAADFRPGQWEAIDALVERRARTLVVQRTGWGKSAVYFLSTRLLRDRGAGPTLLVSPLLALMRNQIDAAERLGIRAATVNSTNVKDWSAIEAELRENQIDVLVISPERFANETFLTRMLLPLAKQVGLFVVDEAHCISDWGHDFRPDYRRIVRVLERLPANVPVCATTATANDRVVADIVAQLGAKLEVCRGPLVRESIRLQTVPLADDCAKLAWLAHHVPRFKSSGVIYALTVRWTERIADWLQSRGIKAVAYSAEIPNEVRQEREGQLLRNEITALVATTALGMGFDKPDLGFVIHFHQPASVVHYYQQVGRAGRSIAKAYGIMLSGGDDREIADYFIKQAFPPERDVIAILEALERTEDGLTTRELQKTVNLSQGRIDSVLKTLAIENPPPLTQIENCWVTTPTRYDPGRRRRLVERITGLRHAEQAQMDAYRQHTGCFMEFLARALDDPAAGRCGICASCQGKPESLREVPDALKGEAATFLRRCDVALEPRVQWHAGAMPIYGFTGKIKEDVRAEPGRALCILGDAGWDGLVRRGKYPDNRFADELVEALVGVIGRWKPTPRWVTCVPSLNHPELVPDLAKRVAGRLSLPFMPAVRKVRATKPQKEMENSWYQANNLDGAFAIDAWPGLDGPVLLIDDIVDSRWTFTVVSVVLRQAGSGPVFPLALAANR